MPSARRKPIARLSAAQARRMALAAQGFADPAAGREPDGWALRRVLDRVGLIQIDSVNVLQRAHYLPLFAASAPTTPSCSTARRTAPRGRLFEYWGHEASLLPVATQPLLRWRMERAGDDAWGGDAPDPRGAARSSSPRCSRRSARPRPGRGQRGARARAAGERTGPWWDWSDVKRAFEWLFWSGQITSARAARLRAPLRPPRARAAARGRRHADARRSRTPSASWCGSPPARCGVAAEKDLRDYFRLPVAEARARVAELVEAGELWPVEVEGWTVPGYVHPEARLPRSVHAAGAGRPVRLAGVGARRASSGCSASATGSRSTSRSPSASTATTCCRSCSATGSSRGSTSRPTAPPACCCVQAAHAEPDAPPETAAELAAELDSMAEWLGLGGVAVQPRGDLAARSLAAAACRPDQVSRTIRTMTAMMSAMIAIVRVFIGPPPSGCTSRPGALLRGAVFPNRA